MSISLTGKALPFGCGVYFKLAPTKYAVYKADARLQYGVFLGIRRAPGMSWNEEYLVCDLDDFVNADLSNDALARDMHYIHPHVTTVVELDSNGITFPLKARAGPGLASRRSGAWTWDLGRGSSDARTPTSELRPRSSDLRAQACELGPLSSELRHRT